MKKIEMQELSEVIQSSNLNFLFGSGLSMPFLPVLGDIEKRLNEAKDGDKESIYKEYLEKVMLPNIGMLDGLEKSKEYEETRCAYEGFFRTISEILLKRKSTILSKQANVFTTNIDVFLETVLESLQIEYNDGFSGRFNPSFGIANYKKSIQQRSLHFDHISEIPVFNVVKIHGSLTWQFRDKNKTEIAFSPKLSHFDKSFLEKTGDDFKESYAQLLVVNPEESKHLESVLNVYYSELLRLYSSELEKENAVLFIMGFSMDDRHIKEITLRAAKSNPTLRIYLFCYSHEDKKSMTGKMEITIHPNIQIVAPEDSSTENKLNLTKITASIFKKWKIKNQPHKKVNEESPQNLNPEAND
jgi:hypothetical protein